MKVAVDRDLCIGCSLCTELCRAVFTYNFSESLAYVKVGGVLVESDERVHFPEQFDAQVARAAAECPTEAIFLEPEEL
jgi:ferredoxin